MSNVFILPVGRGAVDLIQREMGMSRTLDRSKNPRAIAVRNDPSWRRFVEHYGVERIVRALEHPRHASRNNLLALRGELSRLMREDEQVFAELRHQARNDPQYYALLVYNRLGTAPVVREYLAEVPDGRERLFRLMTSNPKLTAAQGVLDLLYR